MTERTEEGPLRLQLQGRLPCPRATAAGPPQQPLLANTPPSSSYLGNGVGFLLVRGELSGGA